MNEPRVFDGHLNAPFFIYFQRKPNLTDRQILDHFGLSTHQPTENVSMDFTFAVIADLDDWVMLADDWFYQLWHMPSTKEAIASLAKTRDVFAWSIGECDQSFEFSLYRNGHLVRQYTVDSPNFDDQVVRINFGEPFHFESTLLTADLPIEQKMRNLCLSLGINPTVARQHLRVYYRPYKLKLDLSGAIHNF